MKNKYILEMSQMNKRFVFSILICALCAIVSCQDMSECEVWTNVMNEMHTIGMLTPTCQHNPVCTGFDCTGGYRGVSIGFGAEFHACNSPAQLHVYTSVLGMYVTRTVNINSTSQTVDMPLYRNEAQNLLNVTVHVTIQLVSPRNISFQMSATVAMGTSQFTPTLVPLVYIRVPECYLTQSHMTATTTTTLRTPAASSTWTGAICKDGETSFGSCGNKQKCVDGRCYCIQGTEGMVWDLASKQCVARGPTSPAAGSSITGTGIIVIVVSILAAVLFASICTVIVIKYRHYQQRYGQHEPLINNEGDDRDLEVDADPPMLEA